MRISSILFLMKKNTAILFVVICFVIVHNHSAIPQTSSISKSNNSPLELAQSWRDKAGDFQNMTQYDSAFFYLIKAQNLYKEEGLRAHYISCFNWIAVNYSLSQQYEKSLEYAEKTIQEFDKQENISDSILAKAYQQKAEVFLALGNLDSSLHFFQAANKRYVNTEKWENYAFTHIGAAVNHFHLAQYAQMEKELEQAIAVAQKKLSQNSEPQQIAYELLAVLYESIGDYDKALKIARESLETRLSLPQFSTEDSFFIATNYNNIGGIYLAKGDYNQAIEYYQQAIAIQQQQSGADSAELMAINNNLAHAYKLTHHTKQSIHYLYKNLSLYRKIKNNSNFEEYIQTYNHLASNFLNEENTDSALHYLHKALQLHQTDSSNLETTYRNIGLTYKTEKNYSAALDTLQLALKKHIDKYGLKNRYTSIVQRHIGEIHSLQGNFDRAFAYLNDAIKAVSNDFEESDRYSNPNLEQIVDKVKALEAIVLKARTLLQYYKQVSCEENDLEMAFEAYQLAADLIEVLKQEFIAEGSKEFLVGNAKTVYEGLIYTSLLLDQQANLEDKKSTNYINAGFGFAEKGKATLLLAALKDAEALTFAELPDSILQQETELKRDLAFYQRKLYEEKNKTEADSLKMATWKQLVFELKRKQEDLQANLKQNYSDYFQLQYEASTTNISQVQQELLNSNKALLEYFVGDSTIYIFAITQNTAQTYSIPKSPFLLQNTTQLQRSLNTSPLKSDDKQAAYQQYVTAAHFLYQQLIAPAKTLLSDEITELIVVADGVLGYIPFETLLSNFPDSKKPNYTLQNLNYFLNDYSLNYAYSATLLLRANRMTSNKNQKAQRIFGGFAPQFATTAIAENRGCFFKDLANLAHNQTEVQEIQAQIGGSIFADTSANSELFLQQANQYRILHLATHACVEDSDPLFSKIFFSDTYLSLADIYNLRLNADLVVLSACNTGTGKLVNGEGIMSLSRGFMYANCPSVVTSLWQVNDRITADLMASFYENLQNGLSKSEALRQAKLTHLQNSTNKFAAPYYWAAFVQLGNSQPIFKPIDWWLWGMIGVVILIGVVGFFRSRV